MSKKWSVALARVRREKWSNRKLCSPRQGAPLRLRALDVSRNRVPESAAAALGDCAVACRASLRALGAARCALGAAGAAALAGRLFGAATAAPDDAATEEAASAAAPRPLALSLAQNGLGEFVFFSHARPSV